MFENLDVGTIITLVISLAATFAAGAWAIAKGKLKKVVSLGREVVDIAATLEKALSDDKITKEEVQEIKKEFADVKAAWKALITKEE